MSLNVWPEFTESWRAAYPDAAIGILAMSSVQNTPPGTALITKLRALEGEMRARYAGRSRRDLEILPALRPYIEHYRRFGKMFARSTASC